MSDKKKKSSFDYYLNVRSVVTALAVTGLVILVLRRKDPSSTK